MIGLRRQRNRTREDPRQSRLTPAQLLWIGAALFAGGAPHLLRVAPWIGGFVAAGCLWRLTAAVRRWRLPPLWVRVPLTLLGFWGVMFTYHSISGVEAGSALLLVMAAMKFLETRNDRDRTLLVFISYFLLFAVFLWEQAIWSAGWLAAGTVVITAALTQTIRREPLPAYASLRLAGRLLLQAVPLAAVLFLLFPRIPGPFWALPKPGGAGLSGLSEEMRPGDITALSLSDAVVFRVRFDGTPPPEEALYWRGPVLDWFDGRSWRSSVSATPGPPPASAPPGEPLQSYQVVLEPHGQRWLLALETPLRWSDTRASFSINQQLISPEPVTERLAYRARSRLRFAGAGAAGVPQTSLVTNALRLPAGSNPRAVELAVQLRVGANGDRDFLRKLLGLFRSQPFYYTLTPPRLGRNAVDDFLFNTRQGFCEHYASAFAVLARAGGIPARVVTGYQGGERNPFGDYWIVRQANAHAWVEVWLDGAWQRYDPTAAVAPERITRGITGNLAGSPLSADRLWRSNLFVNRVVLSWDAFNAEWDRWVLAFGPEAQEDLLLALGFKVPDLMQLAALSGAGTIVCVGLLAFALRRKSGAMADPVLRAYRQMCQHLAAVMRERRTTEAPADYALAVSAARPDLAAEVAAMTALYLRLRYGASADADSVQALRGMVRKFRPRPVPAPASAVRSPR
jgi:transglutaminase-like putative cysteine protease